MPTQPARSDGKGDRLAATTHRESTILSVSQWTRWGRYGFAGAIAVLAAGLTALDVGLVQALERQAQSFYFELRGPVPPPDDVVILAIDEASLSQGEFYNSDPKRYAHLEVLQSWPWPRTAYAIAIEKILDAGGQAVALDILFSSPSSYGAEDDQRFAEALTNHASQVALAAQYTQTDSAQGMVTQLTMPLPALRSPQSVLGSINFYLEPNGQIHRFGEQFLTELIRNSPPAQQAAYRQLGSTLPTLAEATVQASQRSYLSSHGDTLFFYGPAQTFTHIPFWYVLDPDTWDTYLQGGNYFNDKIVIVGSTAAIHQDFYPTPFSESWFYRQAMPGVEIHANAIAALIEGRTLRSAIPQAPLRGMVVLLGIVGAGFLVIQRRQPLSGWGVAMGLAIAWWITGYMVFVHGQLIVPTAVPVGAIALIGFGQLLSGTAQEQLRKQQLRNTLKQYSASPIVQEIISQQDDLQDLLRERERELAGKVLGSRYQIVNVLGSGGFSETYTARDMQRPGNPICVVKQLQVKTDNPKTIRLARRLFGTEAETLEKLGHHDQIPQLMAFFEEAGDFYLIQEFIAGRSLAEEFRQRHSFPEFYVVDMITDLLRILDYVHQQDVIHRDLKPSNIIRRQSDQRLVLIDFGVAKKISTQLAESSSDTKFTVAVGTPGYMPGEQSAGRPHFNSDIYALGVIAIEALTGQNPRMLHHDSKTGTILWKHRVPGLTPALATIVDRMVHHDFTQRYKTAQEVQAAIAPMILDMSDVILGESEDDDHLSLPPHSSKRSLHPSQLQTVIADYSQDNLLAFDSEGTTIFPDQTVTLEDGSEEPVPLDKGVTDHVVTEPLTGPYASTEPSAPYLNQTVDQQDTQVDDEDLHL